MIEFQLIDAAFVGPDSEKGLLVFPIPPGAGKPPALLQLVDSIDVSSPFKGCRHILIIQLDIYMFVYYFCLFLNNPNDIYAAAMRLITQALPDLESDVA